MQDKINKIRQECIKTNPEIVELKFGCKVKHKTMYGKSIFTICRKLDSVSFYVYRNSFKYLANSFRKKEIEIMGRDIRLADVLYRIQSLKSDDWNRHWVINRFGEFLNDSCPDLKGLPVCKVGEKWNLLDDNLEHQSEECIDFIYQLIK